MNQYTIPNLVKATEVLRVLAASPQGLPAVALETIVDIPRTTAFRILKTLVAANMVRKNQNLYFPGPGLIEIGLNTLNQLEIRKLAIPLLIEVTQQTGFSSHLAIPSGNESLIVEVCDSPHPVRVASRPGTRVYMYCSSTGKVFLSYLHAHHLEEQLSKVQLIPHTPQTLTSLKAILAMTNQVLTQGYAIDDRELHEDVRCLAAPIFSLDNQVVAAIGVTAPIAHFPENKIVTISKIVKTATRQLSIMLGAPQG